MTLTAQALSRYNVRCTEHDVQMTLTNYRTLTLTNYFNILTYTVSSSEQVPLLQKKMPRKAERKMIMESHEFYFIPSKKNKETTSKRIIPLEMPSDNQQTYKQTITYDDNGNVLKRSSPHKVSQNGSGFVISYTDKMLELLTDLKMPSALNIFLYIAHKQGYGNPIFGYRCTKKHLQETLSLSRTQVWESLKLLREKFLVLESVVDGQSEFMVNPSYITIGSDKKSRLREWSRRWEEHFKTTGGKV